MQKKPFLPEMNWKNLDFKITREAIVTLPDKVEAIKNIAVPATKKQL